MWILLLPIQVGGNRASSWRVGIAVGVLLRSVGFFFEAVGNIQLARCRAGLENRGRVMKYGPWRYTWHANYFGDFLV